MNVQELRIGNLLNWMGCVCPVVSIEEEGFTVADPSQSKMISNYHYAPDEVICEWELTEEWLVKFGFYKEGKIGIYYIPSLKFQIWAPPNNKIYFLLGGTDNKIELLSVHQLQNLYFALTGTELQIK